MFSCFKPLLQCNLVRNAIRTFNDVSFKEIPDVSAALIRRTLKLHKVNYEEGYSCIIISCPNCTNKTVSSKLYINKVTGGFSCASCLSFGKWDNLEVYLDGTAKKELNVESNYKETMTYLNDVQGRTVPLRGLSDEEFARTLLKFKLPVCSKHGFDKVDVRIDSPNENLYFPLESVDSRVVGYQVLNNSSLHVEPVHNCPGVLTGKSTKVKDSAVLVPTLADFLILLNAKVTSYIVCLPNGLLSLPVHALPSLERFTKLILWFGNEVGSWDSARAFARKLGERRCLFVRPSDKQPLPHLAPEQDFKTVINSAEPIWHKSITTFTSLRQDVLSELQNVDKVHGIKWKRYPTLSRLLKGHRRGELTVITGPTGSGKTTFVSEYSLDLAMQGVTTLWGSFEIRNVRLAKTMLQQMVGLPLDKNVDRFDEFADQFEKLPIYYMTFHGQQSVKVVMEAVEHAQYVHDIAHVIIDNLQFMMGIYDEDKHIDRFWKQDVIIAAFRTFATRKNCHVTLVIHPRKEREEEDLTASSIFGGVKASQEADNILIIQDKKLKVVGGKKYLQVCKNRYSGDLGIMPLEFDKDALSFMQKKKKVIEKADKKTPEVPTSNETV